MTTQTRSEAKTRLRISTLFVVCLATTVGACSTANQNPPGPNVKACGPFGDPPADTIQGERPLCLAGVRLGPWKDSNGTERYACLYEPEAGAGALPMVVYLHPSLFGTETIHLTNLLHYRNSMALGAEGTRGFIVLEPGGRKTSHYYPFPDENGVGWDNWYRQLNPAGDVKIGDAVYKENVDAAAIDHFIAEEAATGRIDTKRVYLTGWSNGAAMAYLYALNRPNIAAAAVYSAPDPFGAFDDPCPQKPVARSPQGDAEIQIFNPRLPNLHIHNNCDVTGICPNCEQLTSQLTAAGINVNDTIVDFLGSQVSGCMRACGTDPDGDPDMVSNPLAWMLGLANHSRWPLSWTRPMLEFCRDHPLK
ncbi:MAG TPA: PHB depolymerase family esterase [Candidatus Binataceae bacterium]|jgi:predicted esterase|nr:PHB depolymerase family esterase [Candidatus Binataceae bacterium]